ncbi:hypothetical protein HMI55_003079 [Coelomomyces lativittatus]|nr:hypothetical protein HMI55_003079 [Coelomomyces lativittatus]
MFIFDSTSTSTSTRVVKRSIALRKRTDGSIGGRGIEGHRGRASTERGEGRRGGGPLDFQSAALKSNEKKFSVKALIQEIETCHVEALEKRALFSLAPKPHMELTIPDPWVLLDTLMLMRGLNDPHFSKLSSFFDVFFQLDSVVAGSTALSPSSSSSSLVLSSSSPSSSTSPNTTATTTIPTTTTTTPLASSSASSSSSSLRKRPSRKQSKWTTSVVCFGNNHLYLILRLIHWISSRLTILKSKGLELASHPEHLNRSNPVAMELGFQPTPTPEQRAKGPLDPQSFYPETLKLIGMLLKSHLDPMTFEEQLRTMFGTTAKSKKPP